MHAPYAAKPNTTLPTWGLRAKPVGRLGQDADTTRRNTIDNQHKGDRVPDSRRTRSTGFKAGHHPRGGQGQSQVRRVHEAKKHNSRHGLRACLPSPGRRSTKTVVVTSTGVRCTAEPRSAKNFVSGSAQGCRASTWVVRRAPRDE